MQEEDSIKGEVTRAGDPGKRCCLPKARCWLSPAGVGRKDGYQEKKTTAGHTLDCSGGGDRRI